MSITTTARTVSLAPTWCAAKWGESVQLVPGSYGKPLSDGFAGKHVLFVDFSLKRDEMIRFANGNGNGPSGGKVGAAPASIVILDHHKTAEAELKEWDVGPVEAGDVSRLSATDNVYVKRRETGLPIVAHFDMQCSGARMAWDFCFGGSTEHGGHNGAPPTFIALIEDRDLWRNTYGERTEMFSVAVRSYPRTIEAWHRIAEHPEEVIAEGRPILRAHRMNIAGMLEHVTWRGIGLYNRADGQRALPLRVRHCPRVAAAVPRGAVRGGVVLHGRLRRGVPRAVLAAV